MCKMFKLSSAPMEGFLNHPLSQKYRIRDPCEQTLIKTLAYGSTYRETSSSNVKIY